MIRLLLADDEHLIRTALAALLGMQDDLDVIAQAASGPEAVAMARLHHPDVAVLDLQMPGLDGIAVAEKLHTRLPDCATLIVTSHGRPGHLKRALSAGVRGFLPKTVSAQVLADVVRTVHAGGRYVDPRLAAEAISTGTAPSPAGRPTSSNSPPPAPPSRTSPGKQHCPPARSGTTSPPPPPNSAPPTGTTPPNAPGPSAGSDGRWTQTRWRGGLQPELQGENDC